jgi:putative ABC transport system substrate-binding protein
MPRQLGILSSRGHARNRPDLGSILRGADPAGIPVREATRLELVISARTADSIGLANPPKLRVMADRVIE